MAIMLDKFEPIDNETMKTMFDLSKITPGEEHIELGSGNGQFVVEAIRRGANSVGYEFDKQLAKNSTENHSINIIIDDCFNADVSKADVITCWFTKLPDTQSLMDKLFKQMKIGARLVKAGKTEHEWLPKSVKMVHRNWICLYIKE